MFLRRVTIAEQTATHLREGFRTGRWSGTLPGELRLANELDISPQTLRTALRQLEAEGIVVSHGRGCQRTIVDLSNTHRALRIGILIHDVPLNTHTQDGMVQQIKQDLESAGHIAFLTRKSQVGLQHNLQRIQSMLAKTPADAWIISSGSPQVLEWFSSQPLPCLALYGRTEGLSIARTGPDKIPAYQAAVRQLIELGHHRIVLIVRGARRKPTLGQLESAFLNELSNHGITTGDYNLPDWKETPEGFHSLLKKLFHSTPPTALIVDEEPRMLAAMQFLLRHGIKVPEQVSLVATDDNSLSWCHPTFAHMTWDTKQSLRRIVRWVAAVGKGRNDCTTINYPAKFISGGSIGPAPQRSKTI